MLEDLTAYFITTDRVTAPRALAALRAQGLPRQIVIVRNVRPLAAAYAAALACETPYCAIIDDDLALSPGALADCLAEFKEARRTRPRLYSMGATRFSDRDPLVGGRGVVLFHMPGLRLVGFPDRSHVSWAQKTRADALGLHTRPSRLVLGERLRGSRDDLYKRYLWLQIRWASGLNRWERRPRPLPLLWRAHRSQDADVWAALLGAVDGLLVGPVSTSKDESFRGPLGANLVLDDLTPSHAARLIRGAALPFTRAYLPLVVLLGGATLRKRLRRSVNSLRSS
ncbi:MAG: hypothetical protein ACI9MR_001124 [Myxococcota bacterium]|jgi:hypothetical protein